MLYAYNKQNPRPAEQLPRVPKTVKPYRPLQQPPGALEPLNQHHAGKRHGQQALIAFCVLLMAGVTAWWLTWRTRLSRSVAAIALVSGVLVFGAIALVSYRLGDRMLGLLYYVFPALIVPAFLFPWLFPSASRASRSKRGRHDAPRSPSFARFRRHRGAPD